MSIPQQDNNEGAERDRLAMVGGLGGARELVPGLLSKTWVLLKAPEGKHIWIGDNPVALYNAQPPPILGGGLGLLARGSEVHLPLSSRLSLVLYCPTLRDKWLAAGTGDKFARSIGWECPTELQESRRLNLELCAAVESGSPVLLSNKLLDFENELQLRRAERFIFAETDAFEGAEEILRNDPGARAGLRFQIH